MKQSAALRLLAVLLWSVAPLIAQTTTVYINDSNGNQTIGTITNGNVYFHDSNGDIAFGTIRDGSVFLSTSKGEITFGTVKNGNVFLTDQKGITTGTIRNGNIFLNNSDGSITTGTFDQSGNVFTTTSGVSSRTTQKPEDDNREQQIRQQNYEAGAALGRGIGSAIAGAVENHHVNSFCKANPTSTYNRSDGVAIPCPEAPLDNSEQARIDAYCSDNPGSWMAHGKHRVDCLTPPNPPNLKWAKWELNAWQWDYRNQAKAKLALSGDEIHSNWNYWKDIYCGLAESGATYRDLTGKKHRCTE
jgi:hypothetical protein